MYYEINVSKKREVSGRTPQYAHYFATAKRSITDTNTLKEILKHFLSIFPKPEYQISISLDEERKKGIDIDELLSE